MFMFFNLCLSLTNAFTPGKNLKATTAGNVNGHNIFNIHESVVNGRLENDLNANGK
jgi:hypothetical protein